ncbi:MAG TPA: hypothetical protein VFF69_14410, partial [Phycisphaerales bacterium]|nr:hypothetical protein [Phycisphaerales bacterium]
MPSPCPNTLRIARAVRRRVLVAGVVRDGGRGLAAGALLGVALVVASRMGWISVAWPAWLAAAAGAGLLSGSAVGAARGCS